MSRWIFVKQSGSLWTPESLSTVPEYWLDASSITGLSDNAQVDTWPNLGALADMGRDADWSEPGYPKFKANQLNGLPGIEWPSVLSQYGTRMKHGSPYVSAAGNLADITVWAVAKSTNTSARGQIVMRSGYYELINGRTSGKWGVGYWNNSFTATTGASTINTANSYLLCGQWDKANGIRTLWVDGTTDGQSTGLGAYTFDSSAASTQVVLGSNNYGFSGGEPFGDQTFTGLMHEVIVLHETADEAVRQKVEGYLAHKWGLTGNLPAGHPYKSSAPTA